MQVAPLSQRLNRHRILQPIGEYSADPQQHPPGWAGLVLGVSFLAIPVKFLALSLSLSIALDIGSQILVVLNRVEFDLAAIVSSGVLGKQKTGPSQAQLHSSARGPTSPSRGD